MQQSLTYRTNRDLFSNHYLDEHLPETEAWDEIDDDELQSAYDEISDLYEREKSTAPKRNESQLEEKFIRPMFRKLGIPFEVEESTSRTQRRPDYGFFESEDAARDAFERREAGGDFYENAVAVADAKRWGRPLDTRGSAEHERDFENPSYQIHVYLQETPAQWAVLTDGKKWRLYYGPTSHRLDSYYEIDLPEVLENGDLAAFKYFYLFFRQQAFLEDAGGDCFLDDVYDESNVFAQDLGEDLQDNIYEAIKVLSEGYLQYPDNDLDEDDLDLVHDASLIYLYRLIFVLYAEAEGRDLLDTDNEIYEESYSLNSLKQEVADDLDGDDPQYRDWQDNLNSRLEELFELIDQGSKSRGIPEEDLYIPAYNGGLFRTDPDEDDDPEAQFLAEHAVGDAHLARVIDLLTRSTNGNGGGKIFVDYSSLDVRHLGSIYEGLLEYQLHVADQPLTLDDGEYVAIEGDEDAETADVVVEAGEVYLTTGSGERKATGSYYTPEYVVEYIVDETLGPLVEDIREDLVGYDSYSEGGFAEEFAERIFELKILDPAMGSGHFLTSAVDYLAREIIDAQERQAEQQGVETIDEDHDINWARRKVAQRCIYGVDLNPLAVELAKVSLWLRTLAAEQPLAFLDHHLKTGNSLVGSDIEDVLANGDEEETEAEAADAGGQITFSQFFDHARQEAIAHVMEQFQDLLSIDNETLEDAKEMEDVYDEVRDDPLYQHLLAMANVHTADQFGLDVPDDAYERMARALQQSAWGQIEEQGWFKSAQAMAGDEQFFHWELEFPVAFYGEDGERLEAAGFDAVIGNPPYVKIQNIGGSDKRYFEQMYDVAKERYDLYGLFTERGYELTQNRVGLIIPNKFFESRAGKSLRRFLNNSKEVEAIVDFGQNQVFNSATIYTCLLFMRDGHNSQEVQYKQVSGELESTINQPYIDSTLGTGDDKWTLVGGDEQQILSKIEGTGESFEDVTNSIFVGIQTSANDVFVLENCRVNRDTVTGYSKALKDEVEIEKDLTHRYVDGKDVSRYMPPKTSSRLIYPYDPSGQLISESELKKQYPQTYEYLKTNQSALAERGSENQIFESWYAHWCPRNPRRFEREKIVLGQIVKQGEVTYDSEGDLYYSNMVYSPDLPEDIPPNFVVGILNSTLVWYYITRTSNVLRGGYYRYTKDYIEPIGVPIDKISQEMVNKVKNMFDYRESRQKLSLDLKQYLGNYEDGPDLPDIGLFQPTASGILDATAEKHENLRVGDVRTERDGTTVTVSATARYKPEDEDAHETDTYGYTETEFHEAFTLLDISENEAALVEAFVPVAVEEAGGFAGFRENATKTNSLVDRLKAITLPDPDDVADDLERYVETKKRADELDAKIEKTDQLIDEIVYDLYDLTDEEIEIVEAAVADD
ncbi:Eco57I restriction-modification methylase domain-containing protein [Halopenitus persicus]|uniref:site-specific DNA-methyltransferase (adenine-specific) n=1 Tax=Halopenitus persicus TaxID=1048396 RepID=A0A1H3KJY6_9EURY|nr:Eco57I restriction-modification methylase domain-containing protein [Halopenitus persicus]SDY52379.1 N-6 DNA Methylase [Halopenitus persicus]